MIFILLSLLTLCSLVILLRTRKDTFVFLPLLWAVVGGCAIGAALLPVSATSLFLITILAIWGMCEIYLAGWFSRPQTQAVQFSISNPDYFQAHELLGYSPQKNVTTRAYKKYRQKMLYDVIYSITEDGVRRSAGHSDENAPAAFFFGGSYTFGEGIDDNETLASRFQEKNAGKWQAFNLGFHGYGPQQMLAVMENGLEQSLLKTARPKLLIYQAMAVDIARCAGKIAGEKTGPQYQLNNAGEAVYKGQFHNWFVKNVYTVINRSHLFRNWISRRREIASGDIDLFVAVLKKTQQIFAERYSGDFCLLYWAYQKPYEAELFRKLALAGVNGIDIQEVLPDHLTDKEKYRIPYDYHPNALAHKKIAEYLWSHYAQKEFAGAEKV